MTVQPLWLAPLKKRIDTTDIQWSPPTTSHSSKLYVVQTPKGDFFIKEGPLDSLVSETEGLGMLDVQGRVRTPEILDLIQIQDNWGAIFMEYILPWTGEKDEKAWETFLYQLHQLHSFSPEHVGLSQDNHIGPLVQKNIVSDNWADFFATHRLMYQWNAAVQEKKIPPEWSKIFESYLSSNYDYLQVPNSEMTLVHGDLWSGNVLFNQKGYAVLIDPAVYYGHWEVDLAMMDLFGGFPEWVLEKYLRSRNVDTGFLQRKKMYQLYYLLIHVRIFGHSYLSAVKNTIGV